LFSLQNIRGKIIDRNWKKINEFCFKDVDLALLFSSSFLFLTASETFLFCNLQEFARKLCSDLGLGGEFVTAVVYSVRQVLFIQSMTLSLKFLVVFQCCGSVISWYGY
jgi:hypothetical protein